MIHTVVEARYPRQVRLNDGTEVTLRPLRSTDETRLLEFFQSIPLSNRMFIKDKVTDPYVIAGWCHRLDFSTVFPLLGIAGDQIVADATLHQDRTGWQAHIGRVRYLVHPDYRGKGLATILIHELHEVARNVALSKTEAHCMAEQHDVIAFMRKYGYREVARIKDYVRDIDFQPHDMVILVHDLTPETEP
ncbi:MAG TPA: GNAT family N-acetyltransferase [Phycisphaerae bacterium]|jgi:RimJ/RimL family protein N-acetyltransferase